MSNVSELIKAAQSNGVPLFAGLHKAEWREEDHPRDENGRFGDGGGVLSDAERNNEAHAAARSAQLLTSAADKASREAGQLMNASGHRAASAAHTAAAAENRRASRIAVNERDQYFHGGMADDHEKKAAFHARRYDELSAR